VAGPETDRRTVVADGVSAKPCRPENGPVQLERRRGRWRATVDRQALVEQQAGWLLSWGIQLESQGCLSVGEGERMARIVAEAVPLDTEAAYRLLHPAALTYIELGAASRLEVRSPIFRAGTAEEDFQIASVSGEGARIAVDLKPPANLIGYEIAWYGVEANAGRPGYRIAPLSADRTIGGATERLPAPPTDYLRFAPQAAFFRVFYKTEANGVTAIFIAGKTRDELNRRTATVSENLDSCAQEQDMCITLPRRLAVNPFLAVTVNGATVSVAQGSTVAAAIRATGIRDAQSVVARLKVTRLFRNRPTPVEFYRNAPDILSMKLVGGETLAWSN
jgi:hypothetical protein